VVRVYPGPVRSHASAGRFVGCPTCVDPDDPSRGDPDLDHRA